MAQAGKIAPITADRPCTLQICADFPHVAIAIPVHNEQEHLHATLMALDRAAAHYAGRTTVVLMLNGCVDDSRGVAQKSRLQHLDLDCRIISLRPGHRHAGWARRLALDAAADLLVRPDDVLSSTDADTLVDPNWIVRTVAYFAAGYDAIAGRALTPARERAALSPFARHRLNQIGRYYIALDRLRAVTADGHDAWPRHYYEGGASIALSLAFYRLIGGAPTPPVAEDKALFDALRAAGARIRHPLDVRVFTSCRTAGRAPGGMADALARWIDQPEDDPLHDTYGVTAALGNQAGLADRLTFETLPAAIREAQRRITQLMDRSASAPQVEPKGLMAIGSDRRDAVPQQNGQFLDGVIPALRIIGLTGPVNEQDVAA